MSKLKAGDIIEFRSSEDGSQYKLCKVIGYMPTNAESYRFASMTHKAYEFGFSVTDIDNHVGGNIIIRHDLMALEQFDKDLEKLLNE